MIGYLYCLFETNDINNVTTRLIVDRVNKIITGITSQEKLKSQFQNLCKQVFSSKTQLNQLILNPNIYLNHKVIIKVSIKVQQNQYSLV